jgi:hypothetical protein
MTLNTSDSAIPYFTLHAQSLAMCAERSQETGRAGEGEDEESERLCARSAETRERGGPERRTCPQTRCI